MAKETWVYLMKDLRTGFHKIGESNNPHYRERTLQAEQPLIELVEAWKTEAWVERHLHDCFKNYRLRGEWFDLPQEHIDFLINEYFIDCLRYTTSTRLSQELQKRAREIKREHIINRYIYA